MRCSRPLSHPMGEGSVELAPCEAERELHSIQLQFLFDLCPRDARFGTVGAFGAFDGVGGGALRSIHENAGERPH